MDYRIPRMGVAILLLTLVIGILTACGGSQDAPAVDPVTAEATESPLEAPAPDSPLAQPESPLAMAVTPLEAPPAPMPEAGASTVVGRLISANTGQALANTVVRLPEVYCAPGVAEEDKRDQCFWGLDDAFSPTAITDDNGFFVFEDVVAREYVFLVGDVMMNYEVYVDAENRPFMYDAPADTVLDLGDVVLPFP